MLGILSLQRQHLKEQIVLLSVIHIATFMCSLSCAFSIRNIQFGKFFYVYPALLVIFNDIFAYVIGKSFGKNPLISLSPNKTIEGFFGGFVFTFIIGIFISYLKIKGKFLPDSSDSNLSKPIDKNIWYLNIPCLYLHNISFVFAASFFAPFCGFLASAIKRVFEKKDFSSLIPGHGGITDRFDCQLIMVFFTYYYTRFVMKKTECFDVDNVYNVIVDNMDPCDIKRLSKRLNVIYTD
ncbi:phosphatidate cytidylyltransferase [Glugoides intestinalis]